jgi:hypothetical protein
MFLLVCGSFTKSPSIDFSSNTATILGILGGIPTLIMYLGESATQSRQYLSLSAYGTLELLLEYFFIFESISIDVFHDNFSKFVSPLVWVIGNGLALFDIILTF